MTKSRSHAAGKRGILAVLSLCSALALSAPAHAQYEVFDPWTYEEQALTYAQAVQQVSQATQQLTQLENQLQTQENMVQSLGSDFSSPQLASVNAAAIKILQQAQGIGFNSANAGQIFANTYPSNNGASGFNNATLAAALSTWSNNTQSALQSAVQVQNQVAQSRSGINQAVANAVNASNTASGQTGALQATNQLLAAVSGQLAQLQDVLITMSQAQTTLAAQKLQDAPVVQSVTNTYQQQTSQSLTAAPGVTNTNSL